MDQSFEVADMPDCETEETGLRHNKAFQGLTTNPQEPPPHRTITEDAFYQSRTLCLLRSAGSVNAWRLVDDICTRVVPILEEGRKRPIGVKGRSRHREEIATILAGILHAHERGKTVSANRGFGSEMWKNNPPDCPGVKAFWLKIEAMIRLGLLVEYVAIRFGDDRKPEMISGRAGCLAPTDALCTLATEYGCLTSSNIEDWPLVRDEVIPPLADSDLVIFREYPRLTFRGHVDHGKDRNRIAPDVSFDEDKAFMRRLTNSLSSINLQGASIPRLQRLYGPLPAFGGRIFALGSASYQQISKEERKRITINGGAVTSIDIRATSLCIALALLDQKLPDIHDDPYQLDALEGFPREDVKAWFVQSLYGGKLKERWPDNRKVEGRPSASQIKQAALLVYPALSRLNDILDIHDCRKCIPDERLIPWAVGQNLTSVEGDIIAEAINSIIQGGGVVLPVFDELIVPSSWADRAKDALIQASIKRLGQAVTVTVS